MRAWNLASWYLYLCTAVEVFQIEVLFLSPCTQQVRSSQGKERRRTLVESVVKMSCEHRLLNQGEEITAS